MSYSRNNFLSMALAVLAGFSLLLFPPALVSATNAQERQQADFFFGEGKSYLSQKDYRSAATLLQKSLPIYHRLQQELPAEENEILLKEVIDHLLVMGQNQLANKQSSEAFFAFFQSLQSSQILGDKAYIKKSAYALFNWARLEVAAGNSFGALGHLDEILDVFYKIEDDLGQAQTLELKGLALAKSYQVKDAIGAYKQALSFYKRIEKPIGTLSVYLNLALAYKSVKDFKRAQQYAEAGLEYYKNLGSPEGPEYAKFHQIASKLLADLNYAASAGDRQSAGESIAEGDHYVNQKNYKKALESYYKALEIYRKLNKDFGIIASLYQRIGQAHMALGHEEKMIGSYEKAVDFYQKAGQPGQAAFIYSYSLGALYENVGGEAYLYKKFDVGRALINKSIEYRKKAVALYEQAGNKQNVIRELEKIGDLYMDLHVNESVFRDDPGPSDSWKNEKKRQQMLENWARTALDYFHETLEYLREMTENEDALFSRYFLVSKMSRAYEALLKYDRALGFKKLELALAKKLNEKPEDILDILYEMAGLHIKLGDQIYKQQGLIALKHYKEALGIYKDLIINRKLIRNVGLNDIENELAETYIRIGNLYRRRQSPHKASEAVRQVMPIYKKHKDREKLIKAYQWMVSAHLEANQNQLALDWFRKTLAAVKTMNEDDQMESFSEIFDILPNWERHTPVGEFLTELRGVFGFIQNRDKRDQLFLGLAKIYIEIYDYPEAIKLIQLILKDPEASENPGNLIEGHVLLGKLYIQQSNRDKGSYHFDKALEQADKSGDEKLIVETSIDIGAAYFKYVNEKETSIKYLQRAFKLTIHHPGTYEWWRCVHGFGTVYFHSGDYEKAVSFLEQHLKFIKKPKKYTVQFVYMDSLITLGRTYRKLNQPHKALKYLTQASNVVDFMDSLDSHMTLFIELAAIYKDLGQYGKAMMFLNKSLRAGWKNQKQDLRLIPQVADLLMEFGRFEDAYKFLNGELPSIKARKPWMLPTYLNSLGLVLSEMRQYEKALDHLQEALKIARKSGNNPGLVATLMNNIGGIYRDMNQPDKALEYYQASLDLDSQPGRKIDSASTHNNLGLLYLELGKYEKALHHLQTSLKINKELGLKPAQAVNLSNLSFVYHQMKKYDLALSHLQEAIGIIEELQKDAPEKYKKEYFAQQIGMYQNLAKSLMLDKKPAMAFRIVELSRAKVLVEKLALTGKMEVPEPPAITEIQKELKNDTALLTYANVDSRQITQFALTSDQFYAQRVKAPDILAPVLKKYGKKMRFIQEKRAGGDKAQKGIKGKQITMPPDKTDLEELVNFYRQVLTHPRFRNSAQARAVGRVLYQLLIEPMEEIIGDKKHWIIVPEGILGFVPFEALIDKDGRYLVETHTITYAPSVRVLKVLKERKYETNRRPLLAFGGAVYNEDTYQEPADRVQNSRQLVMVQNQTMNTMATRGSLRDSYGALGKGRWNNLPHSRDEVVAIEKVVPGTKRYLGSQVTENNIKKLSRTGELARYQVLHFATHGLTVSEIPQLSGLVMSQFKEERGGEDGYLRMEEISRLKLNADFVNLSACETGLGKIYGGEGVVGLSQSFLIAGARGLSLSLWSVQDEATKIFMVGVYQLVQEKGLSYAEAIMEMKRAFLNGQIDSSDYDPQTGRIEALNLPPEKRKINGRYKDPIYWAPFVYYGIN